MQAMNTHEVTSFSSTAFCVVIRAKRVRNVWMLYSFPSAAGLRSRSVQNKGDIVAQVKANVWPEVENGKVRPVVHCVLPLEEAAKGHALMEGSTHIGKIVLSV